MFPPTVAARGVVVRQAGRAQLPKSQNWAHLLPGLLKLITEQQSSGWDVAFVDGSKD